MKMCHSNEGVKKSALPLQRPINKIYILLSGETLLRTQLTIYLYGHENIRGGSSVCK